ncbi:alpha/beta hydrolase family protein [Amycolatopsis regifaucium]|uniref:Acetylhydrolase n=1 Tax=Amycolatopsis regifaucium TaxID=546365 RepID=A0A154MBY3_9PSEU|nr:acetylhydrolase [Amycolatopsis regifaucium]KZB81777.1 acetylhydrolase [Amycolatopsis regifaucium]OKA06155.1 alpha/beta hydrolase [Amycolatopsis regifaucium]
MRRLLVALLTLAAMVSVVSRASADAPSLRLPPPTGSHPVGSTDLHLVDDARRDPWVPTGSRELMVSMFYPALLSIGQRRPYLTTAEAKAFLTESGLPDVDPARVAGTRSSARVDAPPLPGKRALVVLSPGFGKPRTTLTGLAEELASKGFVVAVIGHNYESHGTAFPDGRVTECAACGSDSTLLPPIRSADVSFVLDTLTRGSSKWSWLIDRTRIGMAGHSIGGYSSPTAMVNDQRIRAGVDMDGRLWSPIPASGIDRPFLLLGRESEYTPAGPDTTWAGSWPKLTGWKRWISVAAAGHASFTDVGVLGEQLGLSKPGLLGGLRGMELTRAYVSAFFDANLRGGRQPLLDGPVTGNPEIKFWN